MVTTRRSAPAETLDLLTQRLSALPQEPVAPVRGTASSSTAHSYSAVLRGATEPVTLWQVSGRHAAVLVALFEVRLCPVVLHHRI